MKNLLHLLQIYSELIWNREHMQTRCSKGKIQRDRDS